MAIPPWRVPTAREPPCSRTTDVGVFACMNRDASVSTCVQAPLRSVLNPSAVRRSQEFPESSSQRMSAVPITDTGATTSGARDPDPHKAERGIVHVDPLVRPRGPEVAHAGIIP